MSLSDAGGSGVSSEENTMTQPISPCLWFDGNAEDAVNYYVSVFKDSKIVHVDRFSDVGPDPDAPVVFIEFQINGQPFQAINGGPEFSFSEAVSFSIACANQDEVDYYWDSSPKAESPGPAAGSRTSTASRGRSCRRHLPSCCGMPTVSEPVR
jgi:predicted 3-demethylubiquinone-9 3-methyltransferase (glyoxalase superfamily)